MNLDLLSMKNLRRHDGVTNHGGADFIVTEHRNGDRRVFRNSVDPWSWKNSDSPDDIVGYLFFSELDRGFPMIQCDRCRTWVSRDSEWGNCTACGDDLCHACSGGFDDDGACRACSPG